MFSYNELLNAYNTHSEVGRYKGVPVYVAKQKDLFYLKNKNNYYIVIDEDSKYLFYRGVYVAMVTSDEGDIRNIRARVPGVLNCQEVAEETPADEVIDFDMELDNILMELDEMFQEICKIDF